MNVLSLFDGMSCGQIALNRVNIKFNKYYASEIDKYAQIVSKANYPNTIYLGDVRNIDVSCLDEIDLLIGGSPCQSFSFAGKRKGMAAKKFVPKTYTQQEMEEHNSKVDEVGIGKLFYELEDFIEYQNAIEKINGIETIEILTLEAYLSLKEQGFEFEGQSYLFWEYMRILTEIRKYNPNVKFLLENVMMGSKWQKILTQAIGINPICINSSLVSAQNRERLYWTNINAQSDGLFGDLFCKIPQPKDRGILLKHILEDEVDEKYFLSEKTVAKLREYDQRQKEKGNGFGAKFHSEENKMGALKIGGKGCDDLDQIINKNDYLKIDIKGNLKSNQDKASCFTAGGHSGGHHSDMDLFCVAMRGRLKDGKNEQQLEERKDGKTISLTTVEKDNLIVHNMMGRKGDPKKGGTGHLTRSDGKTYCLDQTQPNAIEIKATQLRKSKNWGNCENDGNKPYCHQANKTHGVKLNQRIRRLTPLECERLQTVPDNYTNHVSDTQRYRMLGNGWTIDVIAYIFSFLDK